MRRELRRRQKEREGRRREEKNILPQYRGSRDHVFSYCSVDQKCCVSDTRWSQGSAAPCASGASGADGSLPMG